jgi:hypothetical protein
MKSWSTQYARSLSDEQWIDEIRTRFLDAINREIESLPFREPLRSTLEHFDVDLSDLFFTQWDIYTMSVSEQSSSLTFTAWFFADSPEWSAAIDPSKIWFEEFEEEFEDGTRTMLFAFDGVLQIDDAGALRSEILRIHTEPADLSNRPDYIFGFGDNPLSTTHD